MSVILNILDKGDPCSLTMAAGALLYVGSRVADATQRRVAAVSALLVLVVYGLYGMGAFPVRAADDLFSLVLRGLFAAGLTLGIVQIVLAAFAPLYRLMVVRLWQESQRRAEAMQKKQQAEAAECRVEEERVARRQEWERAAPEREQQAREQKELLEKRQAENRRRADARGACEILFALHAPDVGERFPRATFDDFVSRHLGDEHPPEYVEERARQLREVIEQHLGKVRPAEDSRLAATVAAYNREVERVQASGLDTEMQETLLALMKGKLCERLLREAENE